MSLFPRLLPRNTLLPRLLPRESVAGGRSLQCSPFQGWSPGTRIITGVILIMSNPYSPPDNYSGFDQSGSREFRRIAARPIERLTEAKDMLGDQYWLFVGICLVGIIIGSVVPMGIILGPMMCGIYLCFRYRMNGIQVRFETLFKGFDVFMNALLANLILIGIHFSKHKIQH